MKVALCLLAASLLLAGCQSKPAAHVKTVPPQVPAGWTEAQSPDGSVAIGVAPGWRYGVDKMFDLGSTPGLDTSDPSASQSLQQMAASLDQESKEAERTELEAMAKKGIVINVILPSSRPIPGEQRTRYYVLKKTQGGPLQLEDAAGIERDHYAHKPTYETIQLPIGEAIRCQMTDTLRDGGTLNQISYVVVDGKDMYSLRFVTQENLQTIQQIAEQVAQSWRIKPSSD